MRRLLIAALVAVSFAVSAESLTLTPEDVDAIKAHFATLLHQAFDAGFKQGSLSCRNAV